MGIWLNGWDGDHAGKVVGRQTNRILVSLTHTDATFPTGLFKTAQLGGLTVYPDVNVICLTPTSREAMATSVEQVGGYVWSIEAVEVDWGTGKKPWKLGVNLFSVMLLASVGHQSGTIATVVIDKHVKKIKPDL